MVLSQWYLLQEIGGKEKQLILKQDNRSSDRLLTTESELSRCSFHWSCSSCAVCLFSSCIRASQATPPTKGTTEIMTEAQSTAQPLPEISSTASSTPGPTVVCRVQVGLPTYSVNYTQQ